MLSLKASVFIHNVSIYSRKRPHNQAWIWCIVGATHIYIDVDPGTRMQLKAKYHVKMTGFTAAFMSLNRVMFKLQ